jgi:hypothetical protein
VTALTDPEWQHLLEVRHGLAYRQLRGASLSALEQQVLTRLNGLIDQAWPPPPALPADVQAALAELQRLRDG